MTISQTTMPITTTAAMVPTIRPQLTPSAGVGVGVGVSVGAGVGVGVGVGVLMVNVPDTPSILTA